MARFIIFVSFFLPVSLIAQMNQMDCAIVCKHQYQHDHKISFLRYDRPEWYDDYDVVFYFLDVKVENNTTWIEGNVTTRARVLREQLNEFKFELLDIIGIDSVIVSGIPVSFTRQGDEVTVQLPYTLGLNQELVFRVYYKGQPPSGGFFSGISTAYVQAWNKNVTWTLSQPFNAKQWWPCKQDLYDKADSVYVFITTSQINKAGSNGLLTATTVLPGGKVRYEWKSYYPISYYLISVAVADYQEYNIYAKPAGIEPDSILIQNYIYNSPGCLEFYKEGIDRTIIFLELFSDLYGMYPFKEEKYGHCLSALGGGMEHQTMTTLGSFSFGLVVHELGHMWFGDNVTCATWSDIWINEGFASYTEYLAAYYIQGPSSAANWMNNAHNYIKSQPGGSVYVPPDQANPNNVWRIFDGRLSYKKGAAIIHTLRHEINNDELFFNILREFQNQFKDSVATGLDFMHVVNQMTGSDFSYYFDQWYFGEGYPIFSVIWNQSSEKLFFTTTQTTSTNVTTLFELDVDYKIHYTDGTTEMIRLRQDENIEYYEIPISKPVATIELDPDNWIIKTVSGIVVGITEKSHPLFFTIAPNPASDFVKISLDNEFSGDLVLSITDLSGRLLFCRTFTGNYYEFDTSSLSRGVYFLTLSNNEGKMTQRLIVM